MRSRTVQPVKRRGQKKNGKNGRRQPRLGDTQPMRPVNPASGRRLSGDTQPMPVIRQYKGSYSAEPPKRAQRRSGSYSGYGSGYQRMMEQRRRAVRAPRPDYARASGRRGPQPSSLSLVIHRLRNTAAEKAQYFDFDLLLIVIFLMCFGLVMLYSTSAYSAQIDFDNDMYYFSKQALIGLVGIAVMFIVSKIDYHIYGAFATEIFALSMILMALVKSPLGVTANGARRWIQLPGNLTLQPAEITKIAVILFISYVLCRLGKKASSMKGIILVFVFGAIASGGVLFLTDNLSTAIIVMAITCVLIFVIHPKTKPFLVSLGIVAAAAAAVIAILSVTAANSKNFRLQRIISWLNPEASADSGSFQVMQGLYAIGSGGFFGKGLGNSTQKLGILPEAQNDWILVIICEELGVFGVLVILCLFGFLLYRLMFIAQNAPDLYGSLIAAGIFVHIALQVILNIAVVTGILPSTGIILPFISYGGTAILFLMAEMGIALGISRRIRLEG